MMLRGRSYLASMSLVLIAFAAAYGGSEPAPLPPPPPPPPPVADTTNPPPPAPPPETKPKKPAMPDIAFEAATPSDNPKKMPKMTIKSPTAEQSVAPDKTKDFEIKIDV